LDRQKLICVQLCDDLLVPLVTQGKKRSPKKMEMTASLNVACLKRLLPIGLNMFGGREQDLIQQSKQMLIDVTVSL